MRKGPLFGIAWRWSIASALFVFLSIAPVTKVQAQSLDSNEMAQVMGIINSFLLGTVGPIPLTLGEVVAKSFGHRFGSNEHRKEIEFNFEGLDQPVSLCFGSHEISGGEISIDINGVAAGHVPVQAGHCIDIPDVSSVNAIRQVVGKNSVMLIQNNSGDTWGVFNPGLELTPVSPIAPFELNLGGSTLSQAQDDGSDPDGLSLTFDGDGSEVSICFVSGQMPSEDVSILFNGIVVGQYVEGENCIDIPQIGATERARQRPGGNTLSLVQAGTGELLTIANIELDLSLVEILGLERATRAEWDEAAVRKVLRVFAFGGHPTDSQIKTWADMIPEDAIAQMLTFAKQNLLLSPQVPGEVYVTTSDDQRTYTGFSEYLASNASSLPLSLGDGNNGGRSRYRVESYDRDGAYVRMATTRGLNPFRQRIALWETNYHLAVNLDSRVDNRQLAKYYDIIMQAHEDGLPYQQVLGIAAKSAAIARQYSHDRNQWRNNECRCNDDFAREIHQLFYGIFGDEDPENTEPDFNDHHEDITIPQTARLLTDMPVPNQMIPDGMGGLREVSGDVVDFQTDQHHLDDVYVLNTFISGGDASAKIDNLMEVSIDHSEALKNLPIMIVSGLADDNLNEEKYAALRAAWASMGDNKNFLEFVRAYAVSEMFHSPTQRKFMTTFERGLYMANRIYQTNTESILDTLRFSSSFDNENAEVFVPAHNVFGGQTSQEAADSATIFEETYNRYTIESGNRYSYFARGVECDTCDFDQPWVKDWAPVIPTTNGEYVVEDVAKWLWNHVMGSLDNYGPVERAYLLPIVGTWRLEADDVNDHEQDFFDLNHLLCVRQEILDDEGPAADVSLSRMLDYDSNNGFLGYCIRDGGVFNQTQIDMLQRVFSVSELTNTPYIQTLLDEIGAQRLSLDSSVPETRVFANQRIHWALSFIFATPYIFAEERQ